VREASSLHDAREYDAVVATGEQVTAGLLAIVLQSMGIQARSWQGWQIPIITDNAHGVARIKSIPGDKIRERLEQGEVAVITGFQGIEPERNRVATLGRGGSDTSAVAVAVAVRADLCDIYTDVDGVYTTDPRIVPKAQRLPKVSYEEMLEMASLGLQGAADALGGARHDAEDARARAVELCRPGQPEAGQPENLGRGRHHHLQ
jgi:aspartate kinase